MSDAVLFYSNTKIDKNLKYLTNCDIEDDFCLIKSGIRTIALVSALEINRLKKESTIDEIYSIEQLHTKRSDYISRLDKFIQQILHSKTVTVAQNFPFKLASELTSLGYTLNPSQYSTLPERELKNENEISAINGVLSTIARCFNLVHSILAQSTISKTGKLNYNGTTLTSEFLRHEIEQFCYQNQLIADRTIVSCGKQSSDPHCQGYGPLLSNEFIVIDLFPYEKVSGYYGDITRTFLKGHASAEQIKMYNTVRSSQELCEERLTAGINGKDLMNSVLSFLSKNGYQTDRSAEVPYGMFHSLGHGFGLEIHEHPVLSNKDYILKKGNVVTLEPGLYYPEIGGVRIEDDFLVTDTRAIKLSDNIQYDWMIE